jgi:general secretion pathway protein M
MLKQLSEREKFALFLGVSGITLFVVLRWIIFPVLDQRKITERQVAVKADEIVEMKGLQYEYRQIRTAAERTRTQLKKRPPRFSLFSYLDELAGKNGLKKKIVYMKPTVVDETDAGGKRSRVEMKLREVTLDQVSRFLFHVETSPHMITISRLSISRKDKGGGLLETVFQVETPEG